MIRASAVPGGDAGQAVADRQDEAADDQHADVARVALRVGRHLEARQPDVVGDQLAEPAGGLLHERDDAVVVVALSSSMAIPLERKHERWPGKARAIRAFTV